jgi:arylsulfatase
MPRRDFLKGVGAGASMMALSPLMALAENDLTPSSAPATKPNFIVFITDDQGYGDMGCFGAANFKTPNMDQLAQEGMRFTNYYGQPICAPSRASLMTGSYPMRIAEPKNRKYPQTTPHENEIFIPKILKQVGYTSAAIGKWHLGGTGPNGEFPELMPLHRGFDWHFGPPVDLGQPQMTTKLLRNGQVVEEAATRASLTQRYADEAISFIDANKDKPFFVYLATVMPHIQLVVSPDFKGKSGSGIFGDVIEEVDYHFGRIMDAVKKNSLDKNTIVLFVSDNGPRVRGSQGGVGNAGPFRGGKASAWEGGVREPCIWWGPGMIPAGTVCNEIIRSMDVMPTFANLSGATAPTDRTLDGHDITPLIKGQAGAKSPSNSYILYLQGFLAAVREGPWKLHLPRPKKIPGAGGESSDGSNILPEDIIEVKEPMLFNLDSDPGERTDVAAQNPDVVTRLLAMADSAKKDLGDYTQVGAGARFYDPGTPHRVGHEAAGNDAGA